MPGSATDGPGISSAMPPETTLGLIVASPCRSGAVFAGHVLLRELGRGGMGVVWEGRHTTLQRRAAIKVRRQDIGADEDLLRERFLREARAAATVVHPHVVTVHDAGEEQGLAYLVLEYVAGGSLADLMLEHPKGLEPTQAVRLVHEAALGLAAIHAAGLLHRDLKPANLLRDGDGRVKVADFGLARHLDQSGDLTAGALVGSPRYLAPELIHGGPATAATDIYALGVTLFELLTGKPAFNGSSHAVVLHQITHGAVPEVRRLRPEVDPGLAALVRRCMARDPGQRPADAQSLAQRLVAWDKIPSRPSYGRRLRDAGVVLILAGVLGASAVTLITVRPDGVVAPPTALSRALVQPESATVAVIPSVPPATSVVILSPIVAELQAATSVSVSSARLSDIAPVVVPVSTPALPPVIELPLHRSPPVDGIAPIGAMPVVSQSTQQRPAVVQPAYSDPMDFSHGWRRATGGTWNGVHTDGMVVAAWGVDGVAVSLDQGSTWTRPVPLYDGGPLPVGEAVVAAGEVWIRGINGALYRSGGQALNRALGLGGVTRMAVTQDGLLVIEDGGSRVFILQRGTQVCRGEGRLVAVIQDAAYTWIGGGQGMRLSRSGAVPLALRGVSGRVVREPVPQSGPASTFAVSVDGARWESNGGQLSLVGVFGGAFRCIGGGDAGPGGIAVVLDDRGSVFQVNQRNQLVGHPAGDDPPCTITMIAACGVDRLTRLRRRLVVVGDQGIWLFRTR